MSERYTIEDSGSDRQWVKTGSQTWDPATKCNMIQMRPEDDDRQASKRWIAEHRLLLIHTPENVVNDTYSQSYEVPVSADESVEFLAFGLLQVHTLFERTPDGCRDEFLRCMTVRGVSETGPAVTAALAYFDAAAKWYADDRERNPD